LDYHVTANAAESGSFDHEQKRNIENADLGPQRRQSALPKEQYPGSQRHERDEESRDGQNVLHE
jgi:hypothetical protein